MDESIFIFIIIVVIIFSLLALILLVIKIYFCCKENASISNLFLEPHESLNNDSFNEVPGKVNNCKNSNKEAKISDYIIYSEKESEKGCINEKNTFQNNSKENENPQKTDIINKNSNLNKNQNHNQNQSFSNIQETQKSEALDYTGISKNNLNDTQNVLNNKNKEKEKEKEIEKEKEKEKDKEKNSKNNDIKKEDNLNLNLNLNLNQNSNAPKIEQQNNTIINERQQQSDLQKKPYSNKEKEDIVINQDPSNFSFNDFDNHPGSIDSKNQINSQPESELKKDNNIIINNQFPLNNNQSYTDKIKINQPEKKASEQTEIAQTSENIKVENNLKEEKNNSEELKFRDLIDKIISNLRKIGKDFSNESENNDWEEKFAVKKSHFNELKNQIKDLNLVQDEKIIHLCKEILNFDLDNFVVLLNFVLDYFSKFVSNIQVSSNSEKIYKLKLIFKPLQIIIGLLLEKSKKRTEGQVENLNAVSDKKPRINDNCFNNFLLYASSLKKIKKINLDQNSNSNSNSNLNLNLNSNSNGQYHDLNQFLQGIISDKSNTIKYAIIMNEEYYKEILTLWLTKFYNLVKTNTIQNINKESRDYKQIPFFLESNLNKQNCNSNASIFSPKKLEDAVYFADLKILRNEFPNEIYRILNRRIIILPTNEDEKYNNSPKQIHLNDKTALILFPYLRNIFQRCSILINSLQFCDMNSSNNLKKLILTFLKDVFPEYFYIIDEEIQKEYVNIDLLNLTIEEIMNTSTLNNIEENIDNYKLKENFEISLLETKNAENVLTITIDYCIFSKLPNDDILKNNNGHLKGLINDTGSICFMNTAIQCLAHSKPLVKYLCSLSGENEFKKASRIVYRFAKLLKKTWNWDKNQLNSDQPDFSGSKPIRTFKLRKILSNHNLKYLNPGQDDSSGFFLVLTTLLHNEMNQVKKKPFLGSNLYCGIDFIKHAEETFTYQRLRDNSIISQLFHGQFISQIICSECFDQRISFDHFSVCTLNTFKKNEYKLLHFNLYIFSEYFNDANRITSYECQIECRITCTFNELGKELYNKFSMDDKPKNNDGLYFFPAIIKDGYIVYKPWQNNFKISLNIFGSNNKDYKFLFCFQQCEYPTSCIDKCVDIEIVFPQINTNNIDQEKNLDHSFNVPLLFHMNKNTTIIQMKEKIKSFMHNSDLKIELYNLQYYYQNKIKKFTKCQFCTSDSSIPCLCFQLEDDLVIENFLYTEHHLQRKYISLYAKIDPQNVKLRIINSESKKIPTKIKFDSLKYYQTINTEELSFQNCLDNFSSEVLLDTDNLITCNNCKTRIQAFKSTGLYRIPDLFIVHFLRARKMINNIEYESESSNVIYEKDNIAIKIDLNINFSPFSSYHNKEKQSDEYELYAISNHSGSLEGGHYWAYCKYFGKWYEYNDSQVMPIEIQNSTFYSSIAMSLYYERKKS